MKVLELKLDKDNLFVLSDETEMSDYNGRFKVSTKDLNLERFNKNPIVLYNHDDTKPIGRVSGLSILDNSLIGEVYITEATETGKEVKALVKDGVLKTGSIGFIPKLLKEDKGVKTYGGELLEFSIVSIPRNQNAILINKIGDQEMESITLTQVEDKINNSLAEVKTKIEGLTALKSENDSLKTDLETVKNNYNSLIEDVKAVKNQAPSIQVKNLKYSSIGDALLLSAEAKLNNESIQQTFEKKMKLSDVQRERFLLAGAYYDRFVGKELEAVKLSYNLDSIADGSTIGNADNFLIADALHQSTGLLNLIPASNQVQLVNGKGYFSVTSSLPNAEAFNRGGTTTKDVQASYSAVTLTEKEYAGHVVIENNVLRNSANPNVGTRIQNQLIASLGGGINYAVVKGTGAGGQVMGLENLTVTETTATASPDTAKVRKDLLKISKELAKLPYSLMGAVWYGSPEIYYDLLAYSTTTGDSSNFARSLETTKTMFGKVYQEDNYLSGATRDLYLMSPTNLVVGYSNRLITNIDLEGTKDRTTITAITGFDFAPIHASAIGKIKNVNIWE